VSDVFADTVRDLSDAEYELFRGLIYEASGINLGAQKQQLVRARLGKRLRAGGFSSYSAYYEHVKKDASGGELAALLDAVSTNTTHLFRERQHFDFLGATLRRWVADAHWRATNSGLRIWSAGCSSGEEPYSLAMTVDDALQMHPGLDWRILATDISTRVLTFARAGVYQVHRVGTVPDSYRQRYLRRAGGDDEGLEVAPELRRRIVFAHFNLMTERFPFRHGFHFIFCRNVMIYFDRPSQEALVRRFAAQLRPGGYLIIGHSESLHALQQPLEYVRPTIYVKAAGG
jgi:chemotaxis protein methyltransferase CheR